MKIGSDFGKHQTCDRNIYAYFSWGGSLYSRSARKKIFNGEIESVGFRGIPIALAGVGLPFLSAYLIVGAKNLGIFAIYGFGFLLLTSTGAFVIKTVLDFLREPVIISKPKRVGARGTFIYTTIQIILIGVLMYIILISFMSAYK